MDDCESRRTRGGVGGEWECWGEPDKLDWDEVYPSLEVPLEIDDVEGRDGAGTLGRVKVSLLVVVERRFTFRPQKSSPYIAAGFDDESLDFQTQRRRCVFCFASRVAQELKIFLLLLWPSVLMIGSVVGPSLHVSDGVLSETCRQVNLDCDSNALYMQRKQNEASGII